MQLYMSGPLVHLLWGYVLSNEISDKEEYIIIGLMASIVLDLPYVFDFSSFHRVSTHYFLFPLVLSFLLMVFTRDFQVFIISFVNMIFHLILDTVASNSPVKWLFPLSSMDIGVNESYTLRLYLVVQSILIVIPIVYIIYKKIRYNDSPIKIGRYLKRRYFDNNIGKKCIR